MTNEQPIRIDYTDQFKRDLKRLHKKYRRVQNDVQPLIDRLENGETPGNQVPGVGFAVYKVRVRSSDQSKGKRGGYRVVYYISSPRFVVLVRIYPKVSRSDLSPAEIRLIIEAYEKGDC